MGRIFYGWRIVGVAFVTHCLTTGIVFYSFGVFLPTLAEAFGWSRAQTSFGFSLSSLCGAFYSPAVGRIVDRRGSRPSQLVGAVAMAAGFWLLHGVGSLLQFYLVMGTVVSFGAPALGGLPSNAAVARWFVRRRGQALGIATAGISMGGVIFVPVTEWLIARVGWRGAFAWLGAIVLVAAVPPVALFMRRSPESMGLEPDGEPPATRPPCARSSARGRRRRRCAAATSGSSPPPSRSLGPASRRRCCIRSPSCATAASPARAPPGC
ncbi:MAG: MFS transporter [Candidatus Binatia bacterium]